MVTASYPLPQWTLQVLLVVQQQQQQQQQQPPPASAGDIKDAGSMPGLGRPPGEGNGNPLQSSCLENPTDRGAWKATVHGVTKIGTRLNDSHNNNNNNGCIWRRKWQPTPVFLPEESHGQRSLEGYSPWCHKESDTTEHRYRPTLLT